MFRPAVRVLSDGKVWADVGGDVNLASLRDTAVSRDRQRKLNSEYMGVSIHGNPKTKRQKIIFWLCFSMLFGFIAYVILKNIFRWEWINQGKSGPAAPDNWLYVSKGASIGALFGFVYAIYLIPKRWIIHLLLERACEHAFRCPRCGKIPRNKHSKAVDLGATKCQCGQNLREDYPPAYRNGAPIP